jgi:alpha-1,3-glucosyltransferase
MSDIHFQYNGFLLGLFILSLACINQGRDLLSALVFSILLNLKHIFLYVSPVYFVYLLFHYCVQETTPSYEGWEQFNRASRSKRRLSYANLVKLSSVVIAVFALSFLPFIVNHQLLNIKDRLFPFRRGLSHAYWAPNVWAIYNTADLVLAAVLKRFTGWKGGGGASLTGGLVAEIDHQVLPNISAGMTFALTMLAMIPVLWRLSRWPHPSVFMSSLIYCSLCSFMLGWHVHEKAILMTLLPLALLACDRVTDGSMFLLLSTTGHYSLFPLLFPSSLTPLKLVLVALYTTLAYTILYEYHYEQQYKRRIRFQGFFNTAETVYLMGFIPLSLVTGVLLPWVGGGRYEFLPLLLTSLYCSLGMCYGWWLCWWSNEHRIVMLESYQEE